MNILEVLPANQDQEIINALRPGLATTPEPMLLRTSSPYRKRDVLWNIFARHFGTDGSRPLLVWRGTP